jgi:hypothetical protein
MKSEQAGRIEDNSAMVPHDDAHIDLWIVGDQEWPETARSGSA